MDCFEPGLRLLAITRFSATCCDCEGVKETYLIYLLIFDRRMKVERDTGMQIGEHMPTVNSNERLPLS